MKNKILVLLLCIAMLISTVSLFASCGSSDEEPTPDSGNGGDIVTDAVDVSKNTVSVDVTGYKIIRPTSGSYTNMLKQQATDLSGAITDVTKQTIRIGDDNGSTENGDYEILLGFGFRNVAVQAQSEITGNGWIIRVYPDEGKIVIAGTTEFLTATAIDYFMDNCLNKVSGSTLTLPDKIVCNDMEMVEIVGLAEDGVTYEGKYNIVYREGLDDKNGSIYGSEPHTTNYDVPYEIASTIKSTLVSKTGIRQATVQYKYDTVAEDKSGKREILVGTMNRPEMKAQLQKLTANQCALIVRDGQIMLAAHNDTMLQEAYAMFQGMVEQSTLVDEETRGKYIIIPKNYIETVTNTTRTFYTDFPQPTGVELIESCDVANGYMLHVYTGEGTTRENYLAYCATLENAGYEIISEETYLEGSSFRTYINENEDVVLHVSHQAHSHADEQKLSDFIPNSFRVVVGSTNGEIDIDPELFNADRTWVKRTDTMLTNYELNRTVGVWGNSYIVTLEDGSFIVYDGGYNGDANVGKDEDYLYQVLCDLHTKVYGTAPSASNPIRISAWLLSHEHGDHFGVMRLFFKKYGPSPDVVIERLMCNFISGEERVNSYNPETRIQTDLQELSASGDNCDIIKVHTGETYYIANAAIRVMYTHEDLLPVRLGFFNNSSTVFYIDLNSTDVALNSATDASEVENTTTMVFLGDLERNGSKCLRSNFGEALEADMVQVAHHGYNGCEEALYKLINPEVVWFPASNKEVMTKAQNAYAYSNDWINCANYGVCREIDRVKLIVTGGDTNSNQLGYNFTLTVTADGIDYENFYDAIGHKVVVTEPELPQPNQGDGYVILRDGK